MLRRVRTMRETQVIRPVSRRGFTLVEMMMVVMLAGALMVVSVPKITKFTDRTELRAAKDHVATSLATARAAAIRRGTTAKFNTNGSSQIWVSILDNGVETSLTNKTPLASQFKTTLLPSTTSVTFDSRGFASGLNTLAVFVVTRNGVRDSVCVSRVGAIMREKCVP